MHPPRPCPPPPAFFGEQHAPTNPHPTPKSLPTHTHRHTQVDDNPWSSTYIVRPPASHLTIHHRMAPSPHWEEGGLFILGVERVRGGRQRERKSMVCNMKKGSVTFCLWNSKTFNINAVKSKSIWLKTLG